MLTVSDARRYLPKLYTALLVATLGMVLSARQLVALAGQTDTTNAIPKEGDWIDYGSILERGALGEWDYLLWGGFSGTVVKYNGAFYFYYQGANGYRMEPDETVLGRSIGVATSPDGINFTKYDGNPVIAWSVTGNGEEGAASGAALVANGEILLYYGANTATGPTTVHADGRLATSADGLQFDDQGIVLDHADGAVWASGDELYPVLALHDGVQWIVYFLPNGSGVGRRLGVAWGAERDALTDSAAVRSGLSGVSAWGMAGSGQLDSKTYAVFTNELTERRMEVRTMSPDAPYDFSAPVETYQFENFSQGTVLLDRQSRTWFMYYRNRDSDQYGVKLAPFGDPDRTPPSAPPVVVATAEHERTVALSWEPATDDDTGIVQYKVSRNGQYLTTVTGWSYEDSPLDELATYRYSVSAVNYHGVEGPPSTPVEVVTLADQTAPIVESVAATGPYEVQVVFHEPLSPQSATNGDNYGVNGGVQVQGAALGADQRIVVLRTTALSHDVTYKLTVAGVRDQAENANVLAEATEWQFTFNRVGGMVGAWLFAAGRGNVAHDTANYGNDGALIYIDRPGPAWTRSGCEGTLTFDGLDDQVTISGEGRLQAVTEGDYSYEVWVRPDSYPPGTTANNSSYSLLVRRRNGLYYDNDGRFRAEIVTTNRERVTLRSASFAPGRWHHVLMTVDQDGRLLRLYVDGKEVAGSPIGFDGALVNHGPEPYYVGAAEPLTNLYEFRFVGEIERVRIYDQALSAGDADFLYQRRAACYGLFLPVGVVAVAQAQ